MPDTSPTSVADAKAAWKKAERAQTERLRRGGNIGTTPAESGEQIRCARTYISTLEATLIAAIVQGALG